jgi:hypothetical protein
MVACSWLLTIELRGAATGVGSAFGSVGVLLIAGFSGSGVFCLVGAVAGFHIAIKSFQ